MLPAALGGHCCVGSHRQRSATLLGLVTFVNKPSLIFVILSFGSLWHFHVFLFSKKTYINPFDYFGSNAAGAFYRQNYS